MPLGSMDSWDSSNLGSIIDSNNSMSGDTSGNGAGGIFSSLFGNGGIGMGTGLGLSALGGLLGTYASQKGVDRASNLIGSYGERAADALNNVYGAQQGLNLGNRNDLYSLFGGAKTGLENTLTNQANLYNQTNQNLQGNYRDTQNQLGGVYGQQLGFQSPYQLVGQAGSNTILQDIPYLNKQFGSSDLTSQLAPNYEFQLNQGQMANQRASNALGGGFGGNALKGLQDYTQNFAGNAYQNAFNNYQAQRNNIFTNLKSLADIGTTSGGQLASLGNTLGGNLASLSSNLGGNMVSNTGQMQGAYNNFGNNLSNLTNNLAGNLTTGTGQMINAGTQYGTNIGNLATGIGGAQASNAAAGANLNAGALQMLGNTALMGALMNRPSSGGGGGGGGSSLGSLVSGIGGIASLFSDIRMKENIEFIGQTPDGINLYDFDYKPEFKDVAGHGRFRGVMAQEIEKIIPSAVSIMSNGFKAVNYSVVFPEVTYG